MESYKKVFDKYISQGFRAPGVKGKGPSAVSATAEELNVSKRTIYRKIAEEWREKISPLCVKVEVKYPELPPSDLPIEEVIELLAKRNRLNIDSNRAKDWQPIKLETDEPVVLAFVGDPHLDDPGCDWELLLEHIELLKTHNVFAFNIGDTTNNWVGNLQKLYREQDTSLPTARRLIDWFMNDCGVNWISWTLGNHDEWEHGAEITKLMNKKNILIENWMTRVNIVFPTGLEVPVCVSHDFKGRSQFNKVHGAVKFARERQGAAILAAGHVHDWGYYTEEHPDTGRKYHAIRARGYKFADHYAITNGFPESFHGATMCAVVDPKELDINKAITVFDDISKAIAFKNAIA